MRLLSTRRIKELRPRLPKGVAIRTFGAAGKKQRSGRSASAELTTQLASIGLGTSQIEPEKSDNRFNHPAWGGHPGYRRLSQAYLAWSRSVNGLADRLEIPDWRTREQLRLALDLWTSAAAPTNTLLGNPAALQKAFDSGGTSLLRGSKN
ncbi:hypothetical protein CCU68_11700 [Pseudomonas gingeri NCPPB 3146 = LMG 5327]|uniref:Poly-beta-hydroxybutyrate polymerase N-terminal domain-containing protein n=2 Tax=Pseudomonas gingeri TaxID=117681 RepID=A0A7Y7XZP8_9PSED|nr:hypothetical protein [Pseudomonas gingeri]NWC15288.1 hypothetical protein [Pseudomonas gingeri]PNQ92396.1 hypothetical protein CCU68_11700 [Pseudomonas gingeri NCPPB 3146 = LMG 5327]